MTFNLGEEQMAIIWSEITWIFNFKNQVSVENGLCIWNDNVTYHIIGRDFIYFKTEFCRIMVNESMCPIFIFYAIASCKYFIMDIQILVVQNF